MKAISTHLEEIRSLFYQCRFSEAEAAIQDYMKTSETDPTSLMNLYFVRLAAGKTEQAKEAFDEAIAIKADAYFDLQGGSILEFRKTAHGLTQEEISLLYGALKTETPKPRD